MGVSTARYPQRRLIWTLRTIPSVGHLILVGMRNFFRNIYMLRLKFKSTASEVACGRDASHIYFLVDMNPRDTYQFLLAVSFPSHSDIIDLTLGTPNGICRFKALVFIDFYGRYTGCFCGLQQILGSENNGHAILSTQSCEIHRCRCGFSCVFEPGRNDI